jgi:SET domain-containing protein
MILPELFIKETAKKGRGIFTEIFIPAGEVIETAPVIVMPGADRLLLDKTILHDYIFEWGVNKDQCAMALGMVPVYNHSYKSNCEYFMDYEAETMSVKTARDIEAGEEITINYNGDWDDETKVWFDVL